VKAILALMLLIWHQQTSCWPPTSARCDTTKGKVAEEAALPERRGSDRPIKANGLRRAVEGPESQAAPRKFESFATVEAAEAWLASRRN